MNVENPLSGLKKIPTWGKFAIAAGGGAVVYYVYKQHEQASANSAAAATTAAGATTSTPAMVTDPTTGESYPADAVDPSTGETYSEEIDEYGSVEAAESTFDEGVATGGIGSSLGYYGDEYGDYNYGYEGEATTYATNAQWSQAVESGLSSIGYSSTDVATALGYYLAERPLDTLPDGESSMEIIEAALAEYGPPPQGSYSLIPPAVTTAATTGSTATTSTSSSDISVPNVVGRTDLDTAEGIITSAGLRAAVSSNSDTGVGNTGKVTSQSPTAGSKVAKGSTVTLTYTSDKADNAQVSVPDEVGRIDLDTAEADIKKAGLNAKATGDISKAKGNKGKVTAQSPKAGTKVAKGSTVTLTYE